MIVRIRYYDLGNLLIIFSDRGLKFGIVAVGALRGV